jgi:hypothetical protein
MSVLVAGVTVFVHKIPAGHIVDESVAVVIDAVVRDLARISPDIGRDLGVLGIQARVDDGDDDPFARPHLVPVEGAAPVPVEDVPAGHRLDELDSPEIGELLSPRALRPVDAVPGHVTIVGHEGQIRERGEPGGEEVIGLGVDHAGMRRERRHGREDVGALSEPNPVGVLEIGKRRVERTTRGACGEALGGGRGSIPRRGEEIPIVVLQRPVHPLGGHGPHSLEEGIEARCRGLGRWFACAHGGRRRCADAGSERHDELVGRK